MEHGKETRSQEERRGPRHQPRRHQAGHHQQSVPNPENPRKSQQDLLRMARTIEVDIIPRLLLMHQRQLPEREEIEAWAARVITSKDREEFTNLILRGNTDIPNAFIATLREQGVPLQAIFLDLLTSAARRLGVLWESDVCDFMEVTLALSRLQQIMRELSPDFTEPSDHPIASANRSAVMVPAPGEQHTFGALMVAEFFRRAGWHVWSTPPIETSEVEEVVHNHWYDMVGFSLSGETLLDDLASGIRAIRRASRNKAITVMVGGQVFMDSPEFVSRVGADGMAMDGMQAVALAESLVGER